MKALPLLFSTIFLSLLLSSCASKNVELGGAPAWIAGGMQIDHEPDPIAPDPAILEFEEEGGPVELKIITDKRKYFQSSQRTRSITPPSDRHTSDLLEPGRDYRIKRLFR